MELRWGNFNTFYRWVMSVDARRFIFWFCGGILVPLVFVPLFFQAYINPTIKNKNDVQEENIILKRDIRNLFFRDEETYRFCTENKATKDLKYYHDLEKINQKRDEAFEKLVNYALELFDRGILDKNSYSRIKKFTQWNNGLYFAHQYVCHKELKSPMQLKNWRDLILIENL